MILGSYADLKIIKTRSVVQIVVEVPLERGKEVTDLFGLPRPNAEIPVLVSRIDTNAIQRGEPPLVEPQQIEHHNDDEPSKPPRPLSQVSAILCNIVAFRRFIMEQYDGWDQLPTADEAADWLREQCGVTSRRELDTDDAAAANFRNIRSSYSAWMAA
jgi:hypothetical protein